MGSVHGCLGHFRGLKWPTKPCTEAHDFPIPKPEKSNVLRVFWPLCPKFWPRKFRAEWPKTPLGRWFFGQNLVCRRCMNSAIFGMRNAKIRHFAEFSTFWSIWTDYRQIWDQNWSKIWSKVHENNALRDFLLKRSKIDPHLGLRHRRWRLYHSAPEAPRAVLWRHGPGSYAFPALTCLQTAFCQKLFTGKLRTQNCTSTHFFCSISAAEKWVLVQFCARSLFLHNFE